jgi:hypothetical protein
MLHPISRPVRWRVDNLTGQNDHIADGNLQAVSTSLYWVREAQIDLVALVDAVLAMKVNLSY